MPPKKKLKKKFKKKLQNRKTAYLCRANRHKTISISNFLTYLFMRFRYSFVVTDAAAFTAMITPYDFDNAEIMRVQDQGTGVFEVCVFAFEKDFAQLEKLAAQFA